MKKISLYTSLVLAGVALVACNHSSLSPEGRLTALVGGKNWKGNEISLKAELIRRKDNTPILSITGTDPASHSKLLLHVPAEIGYYVLKPGDTPYLEYEDRLHDYSGVLEGVKQSGTVGISEIDYETHEASGIFSASFKGEEGECFQIKNGHFKVVFSEK